MASTGSLGGSGNKCRHTSFPSNTASYRGVDPMFSNNNLEEYNGGSSNHIKALQITLSCGLSLLNTIQEHNEQT